MQAEGEETLDQAGMRVSFMDWGKALEAGELCEGEKPSDSLRQYENTG